VAIYGRDQWHSPIYLTDANRRIRVQDSGGVATIPLTIADVAYYNAKFSSSVYSEDGIGYFALLTAIEAALNVNATLDGTYDIEIVNTPSTYAPNTGIRITCDEPFELLFSDSNWTLDPRLLGWPAGWNTDTGSAESHSGGRHRYGVWISHSKMRGRAVEAHSYPVVNAEYSTDFLSRARGVEWGEVRHRLLRYESVFAASVFERRVDNLDYARHAEIDPGDDNGVFEHVWRSFRRGEPTLIAYDLAAPVINPTTDAYEIVRGVNRFQRLTELATRTTALGDLVTLEAEVGILSEGNGGLRL
jgi:hypothetical protein